MRIAALLLLLVTATVARGDIIWRAHCPFPGEGERQQATGASFDTAHECTEETAKLILWQESEFQAGDKAACAQKERLKKCTCKAEKVE